MRITKQSDNIEDYVYEDFVLVRIEKRVDV